MVELFVVPPEAPELMVSLYDTHDLAAGLVIAIQLQFGCALPPDAGVDLVQASQAWLEQARAPVALH